MYQLSLVLMGEKELSFLPSDPIQAISCLQASILFHIFLGKNLYYVNLFTHFFCYQIMTGHEECVQMLLEKEVSILCKDARGRTPLHFAAALGDATWLSELLQIALSEEDCSLKDNQGYTPLHWACYNGKVLPVGLVQMWPRF